MSHKGTQEGPGLSTECVGAALKGNRTHMNSRGWRPEWRASSRTKHQPWGVFLHLALSSGEDPSCSLPARAPTAEGSHLQGSFGVPSHLHIDLAAQGKLAGTEEGKDVRRARKGTLFIVPTALLLKDQPASPHPVLLQRLPPHAPHLTSGPKTLGETARVTSRGQRSAEAGFPAGAASQSFHKGIGAGG